MRAAVPLALLVLLAGCVEVPAARDQALTPEGLPTPGTSALLHRLDGRPAPGPSPDVVARGLALHTGMRASEPTVGATKENVVFMTAYFQGPAGQSQPTVVTTADRGQTFQDVGPKVAGGVSHHARSFDPYLYVDHDTGRVFMDDIWPLGCGMMSFSDDLGKTWTTNPASCGNPQLNDHQTVGTAKPRKLPTVGYPKVVYRCVNQVSYAACATSLDGGLTFGPQVPAWTAAECDGITGHVEADPEGRVFLPKANCSKGVVVAVSEDDGLTWTLRVVDPTPGDRDEDLDLAVDEAGNLYGVWARDGQVWLSASRDHGVTWTPARSVTAPGVTATMFQAVAAGAEGRVAVAYLGTTIPGGYAGKPAGVGGLLGGIVGEPDPPEWADATWNAYLAIVTDALSDDPVVQSVTANDPADPLARGLCGGTRCHGMSDFIDVQLDGEGRPWASFVDVCTAECVTDPSVHWDTPLGMLATLRAGPALRGLERSLVELPAPVQEA